MEVDVVGRHAVDRSFGLGQTPKHGDGAPANALVEIGRGDLLAQRAPALLAVGAAGDVDVEGADAVTLDPLELQVDPAEAEPHRHLAQCVFRRTRVDQRREQHVAREAACAVEVRDHSRPRAIRAAIVPAPSPSSMPTTARAAAHEASIAFNAVRPFSATP